MLISSGVTSQFAAVMYCECTHITGLGVVTRGVKHTSDHAHQWLDGKLLKVLNYINIIFPWMEFHVQVLSVNRISVGTSDIGL